MICGCVAIAAMTSAMSSRPRYERRVPMSIDLKLRYRTVLTIRKAGTSTIGSASRL